MSASQTKSLAKLLKRARTYVIEAQADMLCRAGSYSEQKLAEAEKTSRWKDLINLSEEIDAALKLAKS